MVRDSASSFQERVALNDLNHQPVEPVVVIHHGARDLVEGAGIRILQPTTQSIGKQLLCQTARELAGTALENRLQFARPLK
jgi:hypothetical protein